MYTRKAHYEHINWISIGFVIDSRGYRPTRVRGRSQV